MMKSYDEPVEINRNTNWLYILDYLIELLPSVAQDQAKLINLLKHQRPDIDKICLNIKDSFVSKYQLLINRGKELGIKQTKNPKTFIDYSQTIADVYENLEDYNTIKKEKC